MAVVAEGVGRRIYLSPTQEMESIAASAQPEWKPAGDVPARLTGGTCVPYGLLHWGDLFTPRQLVALTTFCDLIVEVRDRVQKDAIVARMLDDGQGLDEGGVGGRAYAEAVSTYLAFGVSKTAEYSSSLSVWYALEDRPKGLFARQAIPMVWDFPEQNVLGDIGGSLFKSSQIVADSFAALDLGVAGTASQADAASLAVETVRRDLISTDPPYYDNIGYADLSDFFYVWLRRSLRSVYPSLFATIVVPKAEELVAIPHRHGSKENAEAFFLNGMTQAMGRLAAQAHPAAPVTIYYAFKQSETKGEVGTSSTGWETFLDAVLRAGFAITGTWPMRTERASRALGIGSNALASSIVLVCRKRAENAPTISRREFLRELNAVLPQALDEMTQGAGEGRSPVAPVDLSQAIIGPGMAIFSKYSAVLEANGEPMSVRTALQLINRFLAEDDFDADTQFCLRWFEQHGWAAGQFGEADVLARAKATSVAGLEQAGVLLSGGGSVQLRRWADYPASWDPRTDKRMPVWEALHQLIRAFKKEGDAGAGQILGAVKDKAEAIRQLAYRLYTMCERRGWAEDARAYNELITSWSPIELVANAVPEAQIEMYGEKR
jgi:putative DNA methylase